MIRHISIKNFATIEKAEIDFHSGLNTITGETGAGKSVAVEAMSLALGSRADTAYVRSGKDKAVIQMIAEDKDDEYIITREISASGKNICRINDEKLEKDIQELQCYVNLLEERLRQVEDPNLYRKMKKLDRDARLMIHDLKNMKLLNREE